MGIFLFDKNQNLMKVITKEKIRENTQELELGGKITSTVMIPFEDYTDDALYFGSRDIAKVGAESYNEFWMYKIRKVTKSDGYISLDGIHIFYDELKGCVIRDKRPTGTAGAAIGELLSDTLWSVGTADNTSVKSARYYHQSVLSVFYESVKMYNVEFLPVVKFLNGKIVERKVNIYNRLSKDMGRVYEYGDKLVSVVAESSTDELYTAYIGRGKGIPTQDKHGNDTGGYSRKIKFDDIEFNETKDGITVNKPIGQDYIEIKEATNTYGYPDGTPRIGVIDFDSIEDKRELANATFDYAIENSRPKLQLKASCLPGDNVELGEIVTVIRSDMDIRYKTRVFKIKRDLLNNSVVSYEFGDKINSSIGERLNGQSQDLKKESKKIESYIDGLSNRINDSYFNGDGYNYDLKIGNKYGLPAGYYSFNKPIDQNPTKVIYMGAGKIMIANSKRSDGSWRWSSFGDGDGFSADVINAGILRGGSVRWNLEDGTFIIGKNDNDYLLKFDGTTLKFGNGTIKKEDLPEELKEALPPALQEWNDGATNINGNWVFTPNLFVGNGSGFNKSGIWVGQDGSNLGMFGYRNGTKYWSFNDDGTMTIGKSGGQQIRLLNDGSAKIPKIYSDDISAASITAKHIASGTITASEIKSGTITASKLAADAITTDMIYPGHNQRIVLERGYSPGSNTARSIDANGGAIRLKGSSGNYFYADGTTTAIYNGGSEQLKTSPYDYTGVLVRDGRVMMLGNSGYRTQYNGSTYEIVGNNHIYMDVDDSGARSYGWYSLSDVKLKENIKPLDHDQTLRTNTDVTNTDISSDDIYEAMKSLPIFTYNYKEGDLSRISTMTQSVKGDIREYLVREKDGKTSIDVYSYVSLLHVVFKKEVKRNDELEKKIENLENKIKGMK